ncbi:MAG TPA: NAD(P)/FAD-dependent oxidoreductase [Streptosporangiaceae bacterium]|nr:NAD(P)/FAD-dependent oxidoreductase [Streptosporangiaceae bacterium]
MKTTMTRRQGRSAPVRDAPHVVVVGAGFAGVATLKRLTRAGFRVTVVERNLYSTFQPLLYQVATGGINPGDVTYPVGGITRRYSGATYCRGALAGIDTTGRRIKLADGREIGYDYLILATGVSAAYYGIKGAEEYTYGLYTRRDAVILRDRIISDFEGLSAKGPGSKLDITVVGGGATGVELAGTLAEIRDTVLKETFPEVDGACVRVRLVEMLPELLMPFHPKIREYARQQLIARGVEVRLNTSIREVTKDRVLLAGDGQAMCSDITIWAAGVAAPAAVGEWHLPQGKAGRIVVGPDLRVKGQDRIFAVGDIAVGEKDPAPQLAQPALQMGRHAARQVARLARGLDTEPFAYHDKGMMATIGRYSAVLEVPWGLRLEGPAAWYGWLVLHLMYLLGNRNRASAWLNLTWRYLAWRRGGGVVIVGDDPPYLGSSGEGPAQGTGGRETIRQHAVSGT